jgi:conjugal transfer ATP-binding protein TraC
MKVFIVDIGGSYRKLCAHLDGQYVPLSLDGGISLNPFDLPVEETSPSPHKIKFLLGLVEMMTKEEGDKRLPKLERAELEEAIQAVYQRASWTLSTLRELLLQHPSLEVQRYGKILSPWCGNTPYGRFTDATTNLELNRNIIVFDLKGMEAYFDLQAACLFIITDLIWREIQQDREKTKCVIFDECWRLLEDEAGVSFIEEVFRTFRKYHAAAIAISQNIDDFAKSKIAGAILSNSATKWVLMQRGADQGRLQEVLQLNPNEMDLVASLRQERGVYSEAFLMSGEDRSLVVVESTPLEYWLATTDPRDLALIEAEQKKSKEPNALSVIRQLAEKYPQGVAAAN